MQARLPSVTPSRIASAVVVLLYLVLVTQQIGDPLVIDEMEFPRLAEGISDTGRPIYYRGEQTPANIGIWHPPLYAYSLGMWVTLTGFSVTAVRLFGVLLMLGTAWLGVRILRTLGIGGGWGPPMFLALLLLHPYVIQSAQLPDIDSTLLVFSTIVVAHELVRLVTDRENFNRRVITLGLAVGLALASKLTSLPVLALIFVGILVVLGVRRAVIASVGAATIGAAAFFAWWGVVSVAAQVSFTFPFTFIIDSGLKGGIRDKSLSQLLDLLVPTKLSVFWIGMLLPILMVWGVVVVVRHWKTEPEHRVLISFALWAIGVYGLNAIVTGPPFSFPKYFITAFPLMAIVAAVPARYLPNMADIGRRAWAIIGVVFVGLVLVSHWRFVDGAEDAHYSPGAVTFALMIVVMVAAIWVAGAVSRKQVLGVAGAGFLAVAATLTAFNVGVDVYQRDQDESVRYFPGEVGFAETVDRMQLLVQPGEPFLAPKDIGSATYNRYHEQEQLFNDLDALAAVLDDPTVEYAVVRTKWDYSYLVFPEVQQVIETRMVLLVQVGDFLIYRRR